jgi:hypothetical protein
MPDPLMAAIFLTSSEERLSLAKSVNGDILYAHREYA